MSNNFAKVMKWQKEHRHFRSSYRNESGEILSIPRTGVLEFYK